MTRTLAAFLAAVAVLLADARPGFAQGSQGVPKVELTIVPGGWISFAKPSAGTESSFGEYLVGGSILFAPGPLGIEGELLAGLRRKQRLTIGSAGTQNLQSPPVFIDAVHLVVPVIGRHRAVSPYVSAGIGETTVNRLREVGQADTETFTTGIFGGGVKWYSSGRLGVRVDYRFLTIRSEAQAPGTFFGRQRRTAHRVYGALAVGLLRE